MIEAMVMVKYATSKHWEGLGCREFMIMPRVGEHISMDIDDVGQAYKVVAIHHPIDPVSTMGDIYIVHVNNLHDEVMRLFAES
jgi:hypothetical protein